MCRSVTFCGTGRSRTIAKRKSVFSRRDPPAVTSSSRQERDVSLPLIARPCDAFPLARGHALNGNPDKVAHQNPLLPSSKIRRLLTGPEAQVAAPIMIRIQRRRRGLTASLLRRSIAPCVGGCTRSRVPLTRRYAVAPTTAIFSFEGYGAPPLARGKGTRPMAADRPGLPNLPRHWASCRPGDPPPGRSPIHLLPRSRRRAGVQPEG